MKYEPEKRGDFWVAADRQVGVELACWFECRATCEEVGRRTEEEGTYGQYMNGIPVVLIDTPIPRGIEHKAIHPTPVREAVAKGLSVVELFKRHRLNPSR